MPQEQRNSSNWVESSKYGDFFSEASDLGTRGYGWAIKKISLKNINVKFQLVIN